MDPVERVVTGGLLIASLLVALLLAASHSYAAGVPVELAKITVAPKIPIVSESVQIIVDGIWSDGCVPYYASHKISGTTIHITTALPALDVLCGQAESPWSITVELASLPAERYRIEVEGAVVLSSTMSVASNLVYLPAIRSE